MPILAKYWLSNGKNSDNIWWKIFFCLQSNMSNNRNKRKKNPNNDGIDLNANWLSENEKHIFCYKISHMFCSIFFFFRILFLVNQTILVVKHKKKKMLISVHVQLVLFFLSHYFAFIAEKLLEILQSEVFIEKRSSYFFFFFFVLRGIIYCVC